MLIKRTREKSKDNDLPPVVFQSFRHSSMQDIIEDNTITDLIKKLGNPESSGEKVLDLLMIAKYFERMVEHAEKIAKWVLFSITGNKEGGKNF